MRFSTRYRACILLVLSLPVLLLVLEAAYGQRGGGFRPPPPPMPRPMVPPPAPRPMVPQPGVPQPGMPRPNVHVGGPVHQPMPPRPVFAPRMVWITVWTCSRCNREVGRGDTPPGGCPHCNLNAQQGNFRPVAQNVKNPEPDSPVVGIVAGIGAGLVFLIGGGVLIGMFMANNPPVGWIVTTFLTMPTLMGFLIGLTIFDVNNVESAPNAPPPPAANAGPNAPPPGWIILFRSNDPAVWNTESRGDKFALSVHKAHSQIRFLRLMRTDTGEAQIIPITHDQLTRQPAVPLGCEWNGTASDFGGGRRLGIVEQSHFIGANTDRISMLKQGGNSWTGSGFGCDINIGAPNNQLYCWKGWGIPRTTFEIAVSTQPLTDEETRLLVK